MEVTTKSKELFKYHSCLELSNIKLCFYKGFKKRVIV